VSDRDALMRAVRESPGDDAVRLVYADWLEEHGGELERLHAEVIRGGIFTESLGVPDGPCEPDCPCGGVGNRVAELIGRHGDLWNPPLPGERPGEVHFTWRRGFPDAARLGLAAFMKPGFAAALFAAQPVTAVEMTDREPLDVERSLGGDYGICFGWYRWHEDQIGGPECYPNDLPPELWDRLEGHLPVETHLGLSPGLWKDYEARGLARAALSTACVLFGRAAAGLPPL
jgi:uncharacterized protein (TIGR02996 family)